MSGEHGVKYYLKIWYWLLALFVLSLLAAEVGYLWVTLVAGFVIAVVKAGMVCAWFMHLNVERKYIWWLFYTCLAAMGLFYIAIYPDIGKMEGTNWVNVSESKIEPDGGDGRNNDKYLKSSEGDDEASEDPHAGHDHAHGEHHAHGHDADEASAEKDSGETEAPADKDAG